MHTEMLLEHRFAKTKFVPKIPAVTQGKVVEKFTEIRFAECLLVKLRAVNPQVEYVIILTLSRRDTIRRSTLVGFSARAVRRYISYL